MKRVESLVKPPEANYSQFQKHPDKQDVPDGGVEVVPIGKLVLQSERHRHPSLTTNITFNIPNIKTYKNSR